jgi:hypothetical protein
MATGGKAKPAAARLPLAVEIDLEDLVVGQAILFEMRMCRRILKGIGEQLGEVQEIANGRGKARAAGR